MKNEKLRFAAVIEQLGVVYQTAISDELLRSYWQSLKDVPIDDLERAAAAHIALQKWFPKVCELRCVDAVADSVRAWDSAILAIHQHGMYRHVDFEDAVVNATIRHLGGWPEFCAMDPRQESWIRKEFLKTYQALARSGISSEQGAALPGISDANQVVRSNGLIESTSVIVRQIKRPQIKRINHVQQDSKARIGTIGFDLSAPVDRLH